MSSPLISRRQRTQRALASVNASSEWRSSPPPGCDSLRLRWCSTWNMFEQNSKISVISRMLSFGGTRRCPSDVFLQNVILNGAFQFLHARTLLFCSNDVHGQQTMAGALMVIDVLTLLSGYRQRGFSCPQRMRSKHPPCQLHRMPVRRPHQSKLCWQVERHGQAHLPPIEQQLEPLIGCFSTGKSSILTHGPKTGPVHRSVNARGVGCFARCWQRRVGIIRMPVMGRVSQTGPPVGFTFLAHGLVKTRHFIKTRLVSVSTPPGP